MAGIYYALLVCDGCGTQHGPCEGTPARVTRQVRATLGWGQGTRHGLTMLYCPACHERHQHSRALERVEEQAAIRRMRREREGVAV